MNDFLSSSGELKVEVLQSVFWGNRATGGAYGGAIRTEGSQTDKRLYVLNSTIVSNVNVSGGAAIALNSCTAWIENSIVWGNTPGGSISASTVSVRTTCLPEASSYPGNGNINADPKFVDSFSGNLRLQSGSSCLDRGNNLIDYHPVVPGWQPLPNRDLDGNWRIVDGNADGTATIDMGAYERQGQ